MFWKAFCLLCFVHSGFSTGSYRVTHLDIPQFADPRDNVTLRCHYDMGPEKLHSVKWYKDGLEFYRYVPSQEPPCTAFGVPNIRLDHKRECDCGPNECLVTIMNPKGHTGGQYKCEISTDKPQFRLQSKTSQMQVAGPPRHDPTITGAPEEGTPGEELKLICETDPSLPPARISWYINDEKAPLDYLESSVSSVPDHFGLVSTSQVLRLPLNESHFENSEEELTIECDANLYDWLPNPKRKTSVVIPLAGSSSSKAAVNLSWIVINITVFSMVASILR